MALKLPCDAKCLNWKRFKALYEHVEAARCIYYANSLVRYGCGHRDYLLQLERKLEKMFFEATPQLRVAVGVSNARKLNFVILLSINHYRLTTEVVHAEKSTVVILRSSEASILPQLPLSAYLNKLESGELSQSNPRFEARLRFYNLTMFDDTDYLKELFKSDQDKFYIEDDGNIVLLLWRADDLTRFAQTLHRQRNNWSDFTTTLEQRRKAEQCGGGEGGQQSLAESENDWEVDRSALLGAALKPCDASEEEETPPAASRKPGSNIFKLLK